MSNSTSELFNSDSKGGGGTPIALLQWKTRRMIVLFLFPTEPWALTTVTFHDNYTPPSLNDLVVKCEAGVLKKLLKLHRCGDGSPYKVSIP